MKPYCFILLFLIAIAAKGQDCGARATRDNKFGETWESYTKKTVVYVYDFYQQRGQGKFYKVTMTADGKDLVAVPVDLNSEMLKPGSDVYLKVVNINKLRDDITIAPTWPAMKETMPGILQGRNLLGDSMILRTWMYGLVDDPDVNQLVADADLGALYQAFNAFLVQYSKLSQQVQDAYNPCKLAPCCGEGQPVMPSLSDLVRSLLDIKTRAVKFFVLSDKAKASLAETSASLAACKSTQRKLDSLGGLAPLNKAQQKVSDSLTQRLCKPADIAAYQAKIAKLSSMLASINYVVGILSRLPVESDLQKMNIFLANMIKSNQEELIPLEVGPNGLDLNLNIRDRDSVVIPLSLARIQPVKFHQFIPVIGKAQLSFSLGPFAGLPKYLGNSTYAWQQLANNVNVVQPGNNYILVQSGYTHPALGIVAMANLEWKWCKSFGLGPSGGIGLSVEQNPRLAGLAGGSLFLGNWRQLVITAGVAGMGINRLANNWQTVADKQVIYTTQPALSYYKELRVGAFVAMTFTPFPLKH